MTTNTILWGHSGEQGREWATAREASRYAAEQYGTVEAVLAQLLSIRAQVDAAIALVSGGNDEGCNHPADERIDLTEMGDPIRYLCRACGQEVTLTTCRRS